MASSDDGENGSRSAIELAQAALTTVAQLTVLLLKGPPVHIAALDALERRVALPPVDAHLPRALHRGDQQAQLDRDELDVQKVDLDIAGDDDPLVEHALEDVGEVCRLVGPPR